MVAAAKGNRYPVRLVVVTSNWKKVLNALTLYKIFECSEPEIPKNIES